MATIKFYFWFLVHFLFVCPAVAQRSNKALYPSAYRIKRGTYSLLNPTFQRSQKDIDVLFEILLAGTQIKSGEQLLVPDEELASLRQVKKLEVICEDVLPKSLSEVRRLVDQLSHRSVPLLGRLPEDCADISVHKPACSSSGLCTVPTGLGPCVPPAV
ncbi:hypothetical protein WMY93_020856 [Mugilogobius chulae]|uniref:Uncharacterized protein n=1 Tax=Mugilogobius chulae TaxID=88201 RepID=A0AAW0NEU9_9GOBI